MRKILSIALIALCCIACGSENENKVNKKEAPERIGWDNNIGTFPLYGNVKQVTYTCYDIDSEFGEEISREAYRKLIYIFDINGNVVESNYYDREGKLVYRKEYIYDIKGNVKRELKSYEDSDGEYSYAETHNKYDSNGNLIEQEEIRYEKLQLKCTRHYTYDTQGNIVRSEEYTDYRNIVTENIEVCTTIRQFSYDENGNNFEELEYYNWYNSPNITKREKVFDLNNKVIEETVLNILNGEIEVHSSYKYDQDGNCIEENTDVHTHPGAIGRNVHIYNANGYKTESINYNNIGVQYKQKFTYDTKGNIVECRVYHKEPFKTPTELTTYEIEYR